MKRGRGERRIEVDPRLAAGVIGRRGDGEAGFMAPDSSGQDPEPRPAIVEPLANRLSRENVEFLEGWQRLLSFDVADQVDRGPSPRIGTVPAGS